MDRLGTVVGVVGARGGVGATTLAATLGQAVGRADRSAGAVLVDLDAAGGGIDVHLGIEDVGGLRWPDLAGARGDVPGAELTSLLPVWSGMRVLSGDCWRPGPAPPDVVGGVLDALRGCHRTVVVDLGRTEALAQGPGLRRCSSVLVVSSGDLRSVAGVVALRDALLSTAPDVRLALRGSRGGGAGAALGALEVAHVVDLPVAAVLPRDRHLVATVERGLGPVVRRRGPYARAVRRLAEEVS